MSFLDSFQHLLNIWELRGFLLFSFGLQCILVLTASMRKRTSNKVWIGLIWLTYLLADWSAYYAIGLIPPPRFQPCGSDEDDKYHGDLQAFWAPFLLLHIGGPTTIAAFSLEDNETWRRSAFHLLGQAGSTLFIMNRALTSRYSSPLLVPMLLMFVAAFTRYLERVLALYYASIDKFLDLTFQDLDAARRLLEDLGKNINPSKGNTECFLSEVEKAKDSYILFQNIKWIFGYLPIYSTRDSSKRYLLEVLHPWEAFKAMEIQMNLAYDIFYTKTWLIVETKVGRALHAISLSSEIAALVLWPKASCKTRYSPVDVRVTNALVLGGAVVNVVSCFKLFFSYTMIPKLAKMPCIGDSNMLNGALSLRDHKVWSGRLMINRWAGTIPQYKWPDVRKVSTEVKQRVVYQIKELVKASRGTGARLELSDPGCFMREEHKWDKLNRILKDALHFEALFLCYKATEFFLEERPWTLTHVCSPVYEYLLCNMFGQENNLIADKRKLKQLLPENLFTVFTDSPQKRRYHGKENPTPEQVEEALGRLHDRKRSEEPLGADQLVILAYHVKDHLRGLGEVEAGYALEDIWIGLLCSTASRTTGRVHLEQLSRGGELLTLVWLLLANVGLINTVQAP